MKLIKKFKALLIGESILIKHLKNQTQDYPYLLLQEKKIYNEENALWYRRERLVRNPKLNKKLIGFKLVVLFKYRKERLAFLVKIFNDNF